MNRAALLLILAGIFVSAQVFSQVTVTPGSAATYVLKPARTAEPALYWHFTLDLSSIGTAATAYTQPTFLAANWTGLGVVNATAGVSTFTGVVYTRDCSVDAATRAIPSKSTCGAFPAVSYSRCTTAFTDASWGTGIGPCVYFFGKPNTAAGPTQVNYYFLEVSNLPVTNAYTGK